MNDHRFSLILGRCIYEPEPIVNLEPSIDVYIKHEGKNVFAGLLAKFTDGRWFATSDYDSSKHVVDEGGMSFRRESDARWYLSLYASCPICWR